MPETFVVNDAGDVVCDATSCTLRDALFEADDNGNPADTGRVGFDVPGQAGFP